MKSFLEWLVELKNIRIEKDAPLLVRWDFPVPAWLLLTVILITGLATALVYWREQISLPRKISLLVLRVAVVSLVLAVLCRPSLVLQRNRVEPAYVALMVDQSLSMASKEIVDEPSQRQEARTNGGYANPSEADASRLDIAVNALLDRNQGALRTLLRNNGIQLVPFASSAEVAAFTSKDESPEPVAEMLRTLSPKGLATNLSSALDLVLRHGQGRRLAAIVLASDGRLTSTAGLDDLLREAADHQVPIYPLAVGSSNREIDIEISSVKAQSVVFANDVLLMETTIRANGLVDPIDCTVQLRDGLTDELVDEKRISLDNSSTPARVELSAKPVREGEARYKVYVQPCPGETLIENNLDAVDVQVVADRLKVLYVEGYPRFEYRYLKNALLREKSIELSVLLLDADDNFVQEGVDPLRRFPETIEALSKYQVIFFGDVDPNAGWLTPSQMNSLLEFVGQRGGGFGLLAGEHSAPYRFAGTPLERLVPVNIDAQASGASTPLSRGFRPELTVAGRESRIMRFFAEVDANEQAIQSFPELFWEARTLGSRPGATVLMANPLESLSTGAMPMVVMGRYGAGKIFFQATDDTWRWRRHTGELLYDGYWVRVMRELMNSSYSTGNRRFVVRTDRRRYPYGASVRVQVEVLDPQIIPEEQQTLPVRLAPLSDGPSSMPVGLSAGVESEAQRLGPHSNFFEANFVPDVSGTYTVNVPEFSLLADKKDGATVITVEKPDLELRDRSADPQTLSRIAAITGGKVLDSEHLETELAQIRDRSSQIPDDIVESLWDSRLVFLLFVLMISMEWGLRKAFGLL